MPDTMHIHCCYKQMKIQKGAYRDGVKREVTGQGWDWKHTSDLADCETPKLPLHTDDVIPILLPGVCISDLS